MITLSPFVFILLADLYGNANGAVDLDFTADNVEAAATTRSISSISPEYGTALGGTRLSIAGEGFATEFFDGAQNRVAVSTPPYLRLTHPHHLLLLSRPP